MSPFKKTVQILVLFYFIRFSLPLLYAGDMFYPGLKNFSEINSHPSEKTERLTKNKGSKSWEFCGPEGGCFKSIITIPLQPEIIFIGAHGMGGLYKSTDAGESWEKIIIDSAYYYSAAIHSLEYQHNCLLVGTASGLYKSTDLGLTWERPLAMIGNGFIAAIRFHQEKPDIIFMGLYKAVQPYNGFFRSDDGGETWYVLNTGLGSRDIVHLTPSPHDPDRLYICTLDGIYMSRDGGRDGWQDISGNLPDDTFYFTYCDESDSTILFVGGDTGLYKTTNHGLVWEKVPMNRVLPKSVCTLYNDNIHDTLYIGTWNGIYISTDNGVNWTAQNNGLDNTCVRSMLGTTKPSVYVGTEDGIYIEDRDNKKWVKKSKNLQALSHNAMNMSDNDGTTLYLGTDGAGLYAKKKDAEWRDVDIDSGMNVVFDIKAGPQPQDLFCLSFEGYHGTYKDYMAKIYHIKTNNAIIKNDIFLESEFGTPICLLPVPDETLFLGTTNGFYRRQGIGSDWQKLTFSNISMNVVYLTVNSNYSTLYLCTEFQNINSPHGIYMSNNMGDTWQYTCQNIQNNIWNLDEIYFNPLNENTLYTANSFAMLKSGDAGQSWYVLNDTLLADKHIFSVTVNPADTNNVIAAGVNIYSSHNAGKTWSLFEPALPEGCAYVNKIMFDPENPDKIYAATQGSGLLCFENTTGVTEKPLPLIKDFKLFNNYPNPFNSSTKIEFSLERSSHVCLEIFNVLGQHICTLADKNFHQGSYHFKWNATGPSGQTLPSGIYFCRLRTDHSTKTIKMLLQL